MSEKKTKFWGCTGFVKTGCGGRGARVVDLEAAKVHIDAQAKEMKEALDREIETGKTKEAEHAARVAKVAQDAADKAAKKEQKAKDARDKAANRSEKQKDAQGKKEQKAAEAARIRRLLPGFIEPAKGARAAPETAAAKSKRLEQIVKAARSPGGGKPRSGVQGRAA